MSFTWVPFFIEISEWISGYSDKQEELVSILKDIGVEKGLEDRDESGPFSLKEIDPFTFLALILKRYSQINEILGKLAEQQKFKHTVPNDFDGVPSVFPVKAWLFPDARYRKKGMISFLWEVFQSAQTNTLTVELFNKALRIPENGRTKFTQSLFRAFPKYYFPIDKQTTPWLEKRGYTVPEENDYAGYESLLQELKNKEKRPFYRLSREAWIEQNKAKEQDMSLSLNFNSLKETNLFDPYSHYDLNQILCGPPGTGKTFSTMAIAVKISEPDWYAEQYDEEEWKDFFGVIKEKYDELVDQGRIAFTTFHQSFSYEDFIEGIRAGTDEDSGGLIYHVEDGVFKKMCAAAEVTTGTYSDKKIDLEGRKVWKMSLGNTQTDSDEFYQECLDNDYILLGYGREIDFTDCYSRKAVKQKLETNLNASLENHDYEVTSVNMFVNSVKKGDLVIVSDGNYKFRAIAEVTGDYELLDNEDRDGYLQKRNVEWLRTYTPSLPKEQLFNVSISQATIYNLSSKSIDFDKLSSLLAPNEPKERADQPHVFVIDEINRGNIARIFGELITLIEPDKRKGRDNALRAILPYSKTPFSVPENVHILGTMNSSDKSLTQIDLALRRRFNFIEMSPVPEILDDIEVYDISLGELLKCINQRIDALLGRDYLIGHGYFIPLKDVDESELDDTFTNIFRNQIIPLLQEYFFDDWERIGWVLNDQNKPDEISFILNGGEQSLNDLFGEQVSRQLSDRRFRVNDEVFETPEAYQAILGISAHE